MLFITIPKSASSSLAGTLSRQHGIEDATISYRDQIRPLFEPATDYPLCLRSHDEFVEISADIARHIGQTKAIFKYHFPPTVGNQKHLAEVKKVILLRDPAQVVQAYRRGDETRSFKMRNQDFAFCFSGAAWERVAQQSGLLGELEKFYEGWLNHTGEKLIVTYSDLMNAPLETIQKVEAYFGLPASSDIALETSKYSRDQLLTDLTLARKAALLVRRRKMIFRWCCDRLTLRGRAA